MASRRLGWWTAAALLGGSWGQVAAAGSLHLRAREHYEWVAVEHLAGASTTTYQGFTNTLDLWWEEPFRYQIGLAGSPLFATLPIVGSDQPQGVGDRMRLVHLGIEGKGFPLAGLVSVYLRGGVYASTLDTMGSKGTVRGTSGLIGVGYEWTIHGVGLAPEVAWRRGVLADGITFRAFAPAIGVHFYQMI